MAFWGIMVKPGSPVIHSCEKARGRLRISQATLGIGEATKKTVVQCNVGNRSPVLLCALLPDKTESCHLDLEFAEADDVVFSVIGPRSVYLTGYYVTESRHSVPQSDSESYGVDIQNSQSEGSSFHSEDDDEYEDSFIDDGELQFSPPSPVSSSKTMDESDPENHKPKGIKGRRRQLKKRYQVVESDAHESDNDDGFLLSVFNERAKKTMSKVQEAGSLEDLKVGDNVIDNVMCSSGLKEEVGPLIVSGRADAHESDDDGEFLLSVFNKRAKKKTMPKAQEADSQDHKVRDNAIDNVICSSELIKDVGPQVFSGRADREAEFPLGNKVIQVKNKKKKLPKESETLEKTSGSDDKVLVCNVHENMVESCTVNQNIPTNDMIIQIDAGKRKKKRKQRTKEGKTCKFEIDEIDEDHCVIREDKEHEVVASTNMGIGAKNLVLSPEPSSKSGQKWKKRRKELQVEGTCTEETVATCHNVSGEDTTRQGLLHIDGTMNDLPAAGGMYKDQHTDNESEKKPKKRTKKKPQDEGDPIMRVPGDTTDNKQVTVMKQEGCTTNEMPTNKRTLSNELSIEVLANGPPDGKVASPGKKVKIYYTATLKETGHIFDTNVGKSALKFCLGDKEFIDGWTFGIDGMHVGEKRRLVVPPSMGFHNHEENVPPNSWLVYDIELVGVHG